LSTDQATELWNNSDEASAFTCPDNLHKLADEVDWWGVERSGKILAAWPFVKNSSNREIAPPLFSYYVGPMFARSLHSKKYATYWSTYTACLSTLIEVVTLEYPQFKFTFPIGLTDVRALTWWNSANAYRRGFTINPRYTARLDLSIFSDKEKLLSSFATQRQKRLKRLLDMPATIVDNVPMERIIALYEETLRRSGGIVTSARRDGLRRLIDLIQSGDVSILGLVPFYSTQVESVSVILDGPKEANLVVFATSDKSQKVGCQSLIIWQSLLQAKARGKRWFDFNGANTPGRAADKHFYGAKTELYFDCSFGLP
jgi:hypothetical protein